MQTSRTRIEQAINQPWRVVDVGATPSIVDLPVLDLLQPVFEAPLQSEPAFPNRGVVGNAMTFYSSAELYLTLSVTANTNTLFAQVEFIEDVGGSENIIAVDTVVFQGGQIGRIGFLGMTSAWNTGNRVRSRIRFTGMPVTTAQGTLTGYYTASDPR